ncbi:DUF5724 domain-containing protein [Tundrisphaera lichenicola]|uniref:DUF5724 domain-containing protein n=1 Tax=Tundrisphaera lichenicola TaxID=2029860 RepID=UPI003EBAB166
MLKQEEIEKRIEAARKVKPWLEARMDRLAKLDGDTRTVGRRILGYNEKGKRVEDSPWNYRRNAVEHMKPLPESELLRLGEALFPRDSDAFKAAWAIQAKLPYQTGYSRKPFRAPGRPDLFIDVRRSFLANLLQALEGIDEDLPWLAAHAGHVSGYYASHEVGLLLAGAVDLGGSRGSQVEQILRESASGLHEVGQMGRHVTTAFLCSGKPDCWEFIEKLLMAAQRQEGLRQVILESIDFSHPDAFRRMLRLIEDENLVRFSATVRAVDVWLGMPLDSVSTKYVSETLRSITSFLDDNQARDEAIFGDDAERAFLGLWSMAFDDAPATIIEAEKLLHHAREDHRFVAAHVLGMIAIRETFDPLRFAVDDPDPRVASHAASLAIAELKRDPLGDEDESEEDDALAKERSLFGYYATMPIPQGSGDLFDRLARLYGRTPAKPGNQEPLVWPWMKVDVQRQGVADQLVDALGDRPASCLLPYLDAMSSPQRARVAYLLAKLPRLDAEARATLVKLVGDAAGDVRETAVKAMSRLKIAPEDLDKLESLLDRKRSDLRRSVLNLILSLKDDQALASAARLTSAKGLPKRLAGLDLLCQMRDAGRSIAKGRAIAEIYRDSRKELERDEQVYLDKLTQVEVVAITLDDAAGLMDNSRRTPPSLPKARGVKFGTPAALALVKHCIDRIHKHREEPVSFKNYLGDMQDHPLGSISSWSFPSPMESEAGKLKVRPFEDLPLGEVWWKAWEERPKVAKDPDGLEGIRALVLSSLLEEDRASRGTGWRAELMERLVGKLPKAKYLNVLNHILQWVSFHRTDGNIADFALDGLETILASIPPEKVSEKIKSSNYYGDEDYEFRDQIGQFQALTTTLKTFADQKGQWTVEHTKRLFGLQRWIDEPLGIGESGQESGTKGKKAKSGSEKITRSRVGWDRLLEAFQAGWANEHDLFDHLLGPRPLSQYNASSQFDAIRHSTAALYRKELPEAVVPIVQKAMDRILEIELARGESPTVVTHPALAMRYSGGLRVLVGILEAIGRDPKLQRTYSWGEGSLAKSSVFSHLLRATRPGKGETAEEFASAVKAAKIGENSLLALAFYAPQWARFVQEALGWPLFEEAVWWFHAHTKDSSWSVDAEIREAWNAEIRKLTPLSLEDLTEGAVDVDWFRRTHQVLGEKRWARLDEFAKYASGGGGHKRAQLFAEAMLDQLKKADLVKEIAEKRKQDAIRALGLLPLDRKDARKDVLERYRTMQEFIRASRQFGSQRQASEKLAARIGQENLARTAGYSDPTRLQWAMEGLETADLAQGPVRVSFKDITVSLAIDSEGQPEITVMRGERALKSLPPEARKNEAIGELTERKTQLKRSSSRMRISLEEAMCRGDTFRGDSLVELMGNVILRPMLERLVFIGEGICGYPVGGGKGLRDQAGKVEPIKKSEVLRLAHPVDLLKSKHWTEWQRDCFSSERVQPFKQVFRELYIPTSQEKRDATFSQRYAGQQVNPRQALALLGSRGWVTAPEEGVFRTFHDEKLVAWIEFLESFHTPAEIEGLTLERIRFARRGADEVMKLGDVPQRLFSEVMRDVDLIVSVAHRGSVDPEASASTVELRTSLLRETLSLLGIKNVRIKGSHVFIDGTLGEYNVHLGSATTQMMPGGTLFIVPVHSQHRGRIFLPFADDDPKTAEILTKVILLARDGEIKDPNLLDQIRSRG